MGKLRPADSVVLIFQGDSSNAEPMVRFCGPKEKADKDGLFSWIAVSHQALVPTPEFGRKKRIGIISCGQATIERNLPLLVFAAVNKRHKSLSFSRDWPDT